MLFCGIVSSLKEGTTTVYSRVCSAASELHVVDPVAVLVVVFAVLPTAESDTGASLHSPVLSADAGAQGDPNFQLVSLLHSTRLECVNCRFPERARKFPGLVNGCTINWFLSWPAEALVAVSDGFIGNAPIECSAEVRLRDEFRSLIGNPLLHKKLCQSLNYSIRAVESDFPRLSSTSAL